MVRKAARFLGILFIPSALLLGCSTSPTVTENPTETQEVANTPITPGSQPTELVSSPAEILANELDTAFQAFLENMVSYNALDADALMMLLDEEPPPFLLDVRSLTEVAETGRIEGSTVIPLRELATAESIALLPSFDTLIVAYCGMGWRCTIAMPILSTLGWENIQTLGENGFVGWTNAGYPVTTDPLTTEPLHVAQPDPAMQAWMDELLNTLPNDFGMVTPDILHRAISEFPDLILIDVRRAEEVIEKDGIENAIHIPLESFILLKESWPASKEAKILVYSDNGYRSTIAMTMLWAYGYVGVASLQGGFDAWAESGYPVAEVTVHP